MRRQRLLGLLFILPLLLVLGIAVYKLGPQPGKTKEQIAANAPAATVTSQSQPVQQPDKSGLLQLFGMHQTAVAKGRVELTPTEYVNSLEALYRQRGYDKIESFDLDNALTKKKRGKRPSTQAGSVKFFQRNDGEGIVNISATGIDADLSSSVAAVEPYTFSTLVVPAEGGGANWATYKLEIDRSQLDRLAHLQDGEFPGSDPNDVPRLPGLQRIYGLSTGSGSLTIYEGKEVSDGALILKYLEEMPRYGWRLDSTATSEANKVATGVMYFVSGTKSCLIWVTPGKTAGAANVTISSH